MRSADYCLCILWLFLISKTPSKRVNLREVTQYLKEALWGIFLINKNRQNSNFPQKTPWKATIKRCAFISPQNHFTPYHFTPYHFTPHSFHPTFISPHVHFTPHSFHPTFISPHNHFTPRSFHLIFTSHHIVIIQKRLALINQLAIKLWCLLSLSQLWFDCQFLTCRIFLPQKYRIRNFLLKIRNIHNCKFWLTEENFFSAPFQKYYNSDKWNYSVLNLWFT